MGSVPPNDLSIRRSRPEDAAAFLAIFADPAVHPNTLQMPCPSETTWKERLTAVNQVNSRHLVLVADRGGQIVANAQRIELTVFVGNEPAIALYRSLGFEQEGRLRGYAFRDGRFEDVLGMARWRPTAAP